jgi:DNA-binding transcriptional ArsR family regulator
MDSQLTRAGTPDLAALARLLADGTRASFCLALLDGRAWTAAELARHAGVAASTATGHLNLLVNGGLLTQERQGRHRYVRLADAGTAELIESLASIAPPRVAQPRSLSVASHRQALARGRTCYDHLADALGVMVTEAMTRQSLLDWEQGPALTSDGARWLAALALRGHAFHSRWITRIGTGRAVTLTDAGRNALQTHLGLVTRSPGVL